MALVTTLMATPILALISPIYHRGMTKADLPDGPEEHEELFGELDDVGPEPSSVEAVGSEAVGSGAVQPVRTGEP
jgi:hypothetical protein